MVDARDSKSRGGDTMSVRLRPPAPSLDSSFLCGAVAQLVERVGRIHEVTGSNPVGSTIISKKNYFALQNLCPAVSSFSWSIAGFFCGDCT